MITHLCYLILIAILAAELYHERRRTRSLRRLLWLADARQKAMGELLVKWHRVYLEAKRICIWADKGEMPEKEWWE